VDAITVVLRVALLVTFAASAMGKSRPQRFREFADSLAHDTFVPARAATTFALITIGLETASAALLLVTPLADIGFAVSTFTMILLSVGVTTILASNRTVACNCFGAGGGAIGARHLIRNLILLGSAGAGFALSIEGADLAGVSAEIAFISLSTGAFLGLCVARFDDLFFVATGAT
jgi:hypothetical protein